MGSPSPWLISPAKHLYRVRDERAGAREGLPLLSVSISRGVVPRSELTEKEGRADDLSIYKVCDVGDIVVNRMSAYQGALGISRHSGVVSPDYLVLRPRASVDGHYLAHLFKSTWFVGEMTARLRGIGSTDQGNVRTPRINAEELGDIDLRVPPIPVQRAIADYLDRETARVDALIAAKKRLVDILEERRLVLMLEGVAGLLTSDEPRGVTAIPWLPGVPVSWNEGHLKLVAKLGTGHTPSRLHPEWWIDLTIPWITTGEVVQMRSDRIEYITETREFISEIGMANSSATLHTQGTVVLCRTASAGYSAIMGRDMATSQDFATWTCGPLMRPRFLLLCLRAMRRDLLGRLAMGSTHQTIYMPDIESIKVPIPPVDVQDRIVDVVHNSLTLLDQVAERTETQITLLQERRQALINAAVTGELDISKAA